MTLITFHSLLFVGCEEKTSKTDNYEIQKESVGNHIGSMSEEYLVEAAQLSDEIYSCTDCHEYFVPNPEKRELLEWHEEIILEHDGQNRWCIDCHDLNNRNSLKLASGVLLDFNESYKLCGQCHGVKLRDWKAGVHGKRIGEWNGRKEYFLCVHCHDPHTPRFEKIKPEPPPVKQEDL